MPRPCPVNQVDDWKSLQSDARQTLTCTEEGLTARIWNLIVGWWRRVAYVSILQSVTPTWFWGHFFCEPTKEWLLIEILKKTTLLMCGAQWTLCWTTFQSMNTINVPMNTRHWFSCWCFNWIEVKRERRWPFQWPLSMEPCLERNLMNDPGVIGWSGQPCLTPGHIRPWGHLASFEIMCQKTASIWQAFFFSSPPIIRLKWFAHKDIYKTQRLVA